MTDFLNKLENFFFDIFGLILPGLLLSLIILIPIYFFDYGRVTSAQWNDTPFLSFMHFIYSSTHSLARSKPTYLVVGLFMFSYILGHLIKVISIVLYEFLSALFDEVINKKVSSLGIILHDAFVDAVAILTGGYDVKRSFFYKSVTILYRPIKRHLIEVFVFRSEPYMKANENLKTECLAILNTKLNNSFPPVWYSLYKMSVVINNQEGLKSLANFFLSKYNLYRSLSLICIIAFSYYLIFFQQTSKFISTELRNSQPFIIGLIVLLWYTFHVKYKRYWVLCGNEALVSLYYFLNKKKLE